MIVVVEVVLSSSSFLRLPLGCWPVAVMVVLSLSAMVERPEHFYYVLLLYRCYVDDDDDNVVSKKQKADAGRVLKRCAVQNSDACLRSALRSEISKIRNFHFRVPSSVAMTMK